MKKSVIPNVLTLLNLTAGISGILFFQHDLLFSVSCVYIAMILDFLDGFTARLLKVTSDTGKELDSLADMISFGLLPAFILFAVLHPDFYWLSVSEIPVSSFLLLAIPLCSALRLAKFNTDKTQIYGFIGLPTPANAFWLSAIPLIMNYSPENSTAFILFSDYSFILIYSLTGAILMIVPVKLISLKFINFKFKTNIILYAFLLISVMLFIVLRWIAIPLVIILYVLLSVISKYIFKI